MIIPSIPEPARIMNPLEGSEPSVPRKARFVKLMRPSTRPANNNILYVLIILLAFGAKIRRKTVAY
jgi:hypothetical protein